MQITFCLGSAGYGRQQEVTIYKTNYCSNCKKENENVLYIDSSDGEYSDVSLCEKCILQFFYDFKNGKMKETRNCKLCNEKFNLEFQDKLCEYCLRQYENCKEPFVKTIDD